MKHIQPKTLQVMVTILSKGFFSQRMIWKMCNEKKKVSIGQVNNVIKDLEGKGFVERINNKRMINRYRKGSVYKDTLSGSKDERINYILSDPVGLLRYIAYFRSMDELCTFTVNVGATEKRIINELSRKGVIFCLGTAQEHYVSYFRPDSISFYSERPEDLYDFLITAKKGDSKLKCYRIDYIKVTKDDIGLLFDQFFALEEKNRRYTTKVQTVIDMFCDGKGFYTKPLLKSLWGVEI